MPNGVGDRHTAIPIEILMAEDNPADARLAIESLRDAKVPNNLTTVADGTEALAFLRREREYADAPRPDLVLLDLNLPKMTGHELLAVMKNDPALRRIPVVVLTASEADADVFLAYDRHANSYVVKPMNVEKFQRVAKAIQDFWLATAKLPPS